LIDILDEIPAKIFLKDEEGRFVIANSAVAAIYNKKANQIIGTTDYDNHPGEDVDSWRKQEVEIMKKGKKSYLHTEVSGGVKRHLKTIKMPFKVATTGKTGLLGMQFDVTDMKLLEDKLEEMKRKGK
jgi:PAS domain S-box-containing protein